MNPNMLAVVVLLCCFEGARVMRSRSKPEELFNGKHVSQVSKKRRKTVVACEDGAVAKAQQAAVQNRTSCAWELEMFCSRLWSVARRHVRSGRSVASM